MSRSYSTAHIVHVVQCVLCAHVEKCTILQCTCYTALHCMCCTVHVALHRTVCAALHMLHCTTHIALHCTVCAALHMLHYRAQVVLHCTVCAALHMLHCRAHVVLHCTCWTRVQTRVDRAQSVVSGIQLMFILPGLGERLCGHEV